MYRKAEAHLPTRYGNGRIIAYGVKYETQEPLVYVMGDPASAAAPLVRLHSSCFTGDLLESLRCDCGDQLHMALDMIGREGVGVLVYLPQEGRGIGLVEKIKAYALQDQGLDTVEANLALGYMADPRDYGVGIQLLKDLGLRKVRLLDQQSQEDRRLHLRRLRPGSGRPGAHRPADHRAQRRVSGHQARKAGAPLALAPRPGSGTSRLADMSVLQSPASRVVSTPAPIYSLLSHQYGRQHRCILRANSSSRPHHVAHHLGHIRHATSRRRPQATVDKQHNRRGEDFVRTDAQRKRAALRA